MILSTKRIHNSFWRNLPARAKKCLQKSYNFGGKKKQWLRPFGNCATKLYSLATVNELKIIIFVLSYLAVLVASGGYLPRCFAASVNIHH